MGRNLKISLLLFALLSAGYAQAAGGLAAPQFFPGQPTIAGANVLLIWMPVENAASYRIYFDGKVLADVPSNQFLAPLPSKSGLHKYEISALDKVGLEGPRSKPGLIEVKALEKPKNLHVRGNSIAQLISLIWSKVKGARYYDVYRIDASGVPKIIGTVQDEVFFDRDVSPGFKYQYMVKAKDAWGIEGPYSDTVSATLRKLREPMSSEDKSFRAMATNLELQIGQIEGIPIEQVSFMSEGPDGRIWAIAPKRKKIYALSTDGASVKPMGPWHFEETGLTLAPHKMDFGPDGRKYITDSINSLITCVDEKSEVAWSVGVAPPPPDDEEKWLGLPSQMRALRATPSSILCLDKEMWVTDQRLQLIYRFDYRGNQIGYFINLTEKDGKKNRMPNVGEITEVGGGRYLLTFPLSHYAAVVDGKMNVLVKFGVGIKGYIGSFVGIHGVDLIDEGKVLFSDPSVSSLQVFDLKKGAYRYHYSGPLPELDQEYHQRANLPYRKPNFGLIDTAGALWLYEPPAKRIVKLIPSGKLVPPL